MRCAAPQDYAAARHLLREGVLVMPSGHGRLYLAFAHGTEARAVIEPAFAAVVPALTRAMPDGAAT